MLRRTKIRTLLGLAVYGWACLVLPALHQYRHQANHQHGADGSLRYHAPPAEASASADPSRRHIDEAHQAFDDDLKALDLLWVAHAGVATVDCELSRYTLVDCDVAATVAAATPSPPHTFGDELIARLPHSHPAQDYTDPHHGLRSLEHFGLAVLAAPTYLLAPPSLPLIAASTFATCDETGHRFAQATRVRGPPLAIV